MIPKIIHQIWLGGAEKSPMIKQCQDSVRSLPGFEYKEWTERNFDTSQFKSASRWCRDKVWSHASDQIRFHILHELGGVYLDTDMEIIDVEGLSILLEEYSQYESIFCRESSRDMGTPDRIGSAFIASQPKVPLFSYFVKRYEDTWDSGSRRFVTGPRMLTEHLIATSNPSLDDFVILDHDYFFPMTWEHFLSNEECQHSRVKIEKYNTARTIAFHWAGMSWHRKKRK